MQRTVTVHVRKDDAISRTIRMFNDCTNFFLEVGHKNRTWSKRKLQSIGYHEARERFPGLQSSLVQGARDCAADMLRRERCRTLPVKKPYSSIRYNQRTFKAFLDSGYLSVSTVDGRKRIPIRIPAYFEKYKHGRVVALRLRERKGKRRGRKRERGRKGGGWGLTIDIIVDIDPPPRTAPARPRVVGVDRGINNIAVTSDNTFFNSRTIKKVRGRYAYLRRRLQSVGTRSAKRKLKSLSGRERRFQTDVNHRISKEIANMDANVIVLENLHFRNGKRKGKDFNRKQGGWAFAQLEAFLGYKCEALGKEVVLVPPEYTSKMCSRCGRLGRRKGHRFRCPFCGLELNADLNGARNIARLGSALTGRLSVNEPNVAGCDTGHGTPVEPGYKPPVSTGGS
jgi:putative transposase